MVRIGKIGKATWVFIWVWVALNLLDTIFSLYMMQYLGTSETWYIFQWTGGSMVWTTVAKWVVVLLVILGMLRYRTWVLWALVAAPLAAVANNTYLLLMYS